MYLAISKSTSSCLWKHSLRFISTSASSDSPPLSDVPHLSPDDPAIHKSPSPWSEVQSSSRSKTLIPSIWRTNAIGNHRLHQFEWGLKMQTPKYIAKPTASYIHNDYFNPPAPNIKWDDLNEGWEVFWFDGNKLNAKPFPIRSYGKRLAKEKAIAFAKVQQVATLVLQLSPFISVGNCALDIHYDEVLQAWGCRFYKNGHSVSRYFAAGTHGYERSRQLAVSISATAKHKHNVEMKKIRKLFH